MQALVTGGSGFIGSALIESLLMQGMGVKALLRETSSREFLKGLNFETSLGDLRDDASLERAVQGVDFVFHLAGAVMARDRNEFFQHNAEGTARLARAVAKANPKLKRFVYVSSVAAAGPAACSDPLTEDCTPSPISDYGHSKLEGERLAASILGEIPMSVLRPPPVYGPRDRGIYQFIRILDRGIAPVFRARNADGEKYFNFIYVSDLVDMTIRAALNENQAARETYFAVGNEILSWSTIMKTVLEALGRKRVLKIPVPQLVLHGAARTNSAIMKLTGKKLEFNLDKYREMVPDYYLYSNARAREKLGFEEKYPLALGMKKTVEWYRNHGWL